MYKINGRSKTQPESLIVGKHYVDVNTSATAIQVPKEGVRHKKTYEPSELETIYKYTSERYSLSEYLKKIANDNDVVAVAVAELSDIVLGG